MLVCTTVTESVIQGKADIAKGSVIVWNSSHSVSTCTGDYREEKGAGERCMQTDQEAVNTKGS